MVRGRRLEARLETEAPVREREHDARQRRPQKAVRQEHAGDGRQGRVALRRRPVPGVVEQGTQAERVQHRGDVLPRRIVAGRAAGDEEQHQQAHRADVAPQHRARRGRDREAQRGRDQQRRQAEREQAEHIVGQRRRAELLGIHPRRHRSDPQAQRHHREHGECRGARADEAAAEVTRLADRRRPDDGGEVGVVVAHDDVGHHGHGDEDREDAQPDERLHGDERRIPVGVAQAAELHVLAGDGEERQQEEDQGSDPEDGAPELVAPFEGGDVTKHGQRILSARRRCATPRSRTAPWPCAARAAWRSRPRPGRRSPARSADPAPRRTARG